MSTISTIARSGLQAATAGMHVAGHNVANGQVEGFKRQRLELTTDPAGGVTVNLGEAEAAGGRLEADMVGLLQSQNAFTANLLVFKAGIESLGSLLDVRA